MVGSSKFRRSFAEKPVVVDGGEERAFGSQAAQAQLPAPPPGNSQPSVQLPARSWLRSASSLQRVVSVPSSQQGGQDQVDVCRGLQWVCPVATGLSHSRPHPFCCFYSLTLRKL